MATLCVAVCAPQGFSEPNQSQVKGLSVTVDPDLLLDQVDEMKAELNSKHCGYLSQQQLLDTLMLQLTSR